MYEYKKLVNRVLTNGEPIKGRNGDTIRTVGETFYHDMRVGFPCLTLRELNYRHAITELRFFLQGRTDVKWLNDRGNHFWDKFADKQGYLGPIYGKQWVNWRYDDYKSCFIDQIEWAIDTLKVNPTSRRLLVSAWNPPELDEMCLPPCHDSFQFLSNGTYLDLIWRQRSCDIAVGLPWDILLYAFLLSIVAKECQLIPRHLHGQFGDLHLYKAHEAQIVELCNRQLQILPELVWTVGMTFEIFRDSDKAANKIHLISYKPNIKMKFEVIP